MGESKEVLDDRGEDVEDKEDEEEVKDCSGKKPLKDFGPVAQGSKDINSDSHVDLCVFGNLQKRGVWDRAMKTKCVMKTNGFVDILDFEVWSMNH